MNRLFALLKDGLGILMHLTDLVRAAADLEYSRVTNIKN